MIEKIKMLWHDSDETNMNAIVGSGGRFDLKIEGFLVGTLEYHNSEWSFQYSDWFKQQDMYSPLANFPNVHTRYTSKQLWPFFASRLPGSNQLKAQNEDTQDILSLLRKYATHVISNPYVLISI